MTPKTIIVNGTFDVLHRGHLRLLNYARSLGDRLVVAIDSDRRVKEKKGVSRPINTQGERMEMLLNLKCVDSVRVFDSDHQLRNIISDCGASTIVKGSDHKDSVVEGADLVDKVIWFERIDGYSTTQKIQAAANR